jgi:hypothetical protein
MALVMLRWTQFGAKPQHQQVKTRQEKKAGANRKQPDPMTVPEPVTYILRI